MNFKSYGFWTALAGAVTIFVSALGKCFGFSVDNSVITDVIMAIAGVLVVLGVVAMPKKSLSKSQENTQEDTEEKEESNEETSQEEENKE